ncbi:major facilitator superfamily domain-containing protein [Phascolomyces articulosus]|uniref:Major facilitator superfamily domain-containing protein n=1 Tax=Phascolomyces articulosus TaxID=60185 RepID=A0AAD5K4Y5_9FUNG|nr:major facilitator superfamily domain-containing protein [Phascolomyces articulosus]
MTPSFRSKNDDKELSTITSTYCCNAKEMDIEKAPNSSFSSTSNEQPSNCDSQNTIDKKHSGAKKGITERSSPSKDEFEDIVPDGKYGWAVVLAGFFGYITIFGMSNVYGVFSQAYATTTLKNKASTLELMTVGSVIFVSVNVLSPISILLARFGTRFNYGLGSILTCLGVILAGFSTEIWHLYLTQGLLFGFGASFLYMSISSVIPQWFTTRRGVAMGISSAGSGLGALFLSPMANSLIMKYGLPWAYRILGFFFLGLCTIGTILIKDRLPSSHRKNLPIKSPIQLSMFKEIDFNLWLLGSVIGVMGYLPPLFYLPKYAADIGIGPTDASSLLSVLSASNAVFRVALGFIADTIGRLNMFIIASALSGIFSFVIWPFANSYGVLLAYCILWGGTSGMYYALAAPITASVVGMEKLSAGLSIAFLMSAIAAMGTPISAAIQQVTPNNGYLGIQIFDGSVYVLGAIICLYLKYRLTGSILSKY